MRIAPTPSRPLALVTGASSGIGFELAIQFATNGFDLLVTSQSNEIEDAADNLRRLGAQVNYFRADLRDSTDVRALYRWARTHGPVEALALNAGVGVSGDFLRETKLEDNLRMIDLNVVSVVHLAKLVGADMVERRRGKILLTSATAALIPTPALAVYTATKAFVQSFAASLREELEGTGVNITCLMPGPTDTAWFTRAGIANGPLVKLKRDDPADVARDGFAALMAGRDQVVAGSITNNLHATLARLLPQKLIASVGRQIARAETLVH